MAREKMIELVSKNICVSRNAAREALEAQNWNVLEAALLLQRQERARQLEAMRRRRDNRL
jgi:hypothetical protein